MNRKKLPLGISTFKKIIQENCYYVDKTPFIEKLVNEGSYYFLSRPRRFGKSLFVDTLSEAFSGNRELFKGLYLENNWDWSKKYPVVRISFAEGKIENREQLDKRILKILRLNAENLSVVVDEDNDIAGYFIDLIQRSEKRHNERVVVLVDEYDKPILDNLSRPEVATQMRDGLSNLYSVLKGQDAYLKFVFLTGVSKFTKVSIFSELNNLTDITLDARYATICGYTDHDIDTIFAPELEGLDRDEIRHWYNGYSWLLERVYNPFDVLQLFDKREFCAWWFETGTPTFLVNWLRDNNFYTPSLEQTFANYDLISAFDVNYILPEALLWQTGYLTITEKLESLGLQEYYLGVPNKEVRVALNNLLLTNWLPRDPGLAYGVRKMRLALMQGDVEFVKNHFIRLFASIPHDWYRNNPIAQYEGYYASVFYSHLAALGLDIIAEDVSQVGQCDLVVKYGNRVYIFEFKVIDGEEPTGEAMRQLIERDYAAKYRDGNNEIVQIGIEFSRTKRQVVGWEVV